MKFIDQKPTFKIVTVKHERKCNVCGGVIPKNTKAKFWNWVLKSIAYTHTHC